MKKFWNWLNGKKRNLAHGYWLVVIPSIVVIWPEGAPEMVAKISAILGIIFSAIGYGHAAVKKVRG
jgi:hypothetical protein